MAQLDPALQDNINELQTRHTALVDAVRAYSGGSVAQATNDLLEQAETTNTTIDDRESALLGLIQKNTTDPVPSLLSDFGTKTYLTGVRRLEHGVGFHDMWDFSRASTREVWNPNAILTEVSSDTVAYEYDPYTGEPRGISIEPERTNLLDDSRLINGWAQSRIIIDTNVELAYDGTERVVPTFIPNTEDNNHFIYWGNIPIDSNVTYTISAWVEDNSYHRLRFIFRSDVGTPPDNSSLTLDELEQANGYTRWGYTFTTPSDCEDIQIRLYLYEGSSITYPGDGTTGTKMTECQLERGESATTNIETTGTTKTRNAESVFRDLGDEFNPNGFSIYAEAIQKSDPGYVFYSHSDDVNDELSVGLPGFDGRALHLRKGGSNLARIDLNLFSSFVPNELTKLLMAYDPNNNQCRITINGETQSIGLGGETVRLETIQLGRHPNGSFNINGTVKDFQMYPSSIPQGEAEAMTS